MTFYHNVSLNSGGKLLVAELPVHPTKLEQQIEWSKYANENEASFCWTLRYLVEFSETGGF